MAKNILIFGASTTYGAWDIEGGWVARLRKFFDEKVITSNYRDQHLVYNLGVSGDKSRDILKRFEGEMEARFDLEEETIILFHLGINDAIFNQKMNSVECSLEEFKENLTRLINLARKYSQKIVVIGSMPVDKRVDPMPWAPGRSYKNEYVSKFNEIMEEVAKEQDIYFVEIYKRFIDKDYSDLLADGVHITAEGHKAFFEIVKDFLLGSNII